MGTGQILVLGAPAGLTISLGLPVGRLRNPALRMKAFLSAAARGIDPVCRLKPRTPCSILFGGGAGSFAVLAGWQTRVSVLAPAPLLLAAVLFRFLFLYLALRWAIG